MPERPDSPVQLPQSFVDEWSHEVQWLSDLPRLVDECVQDWGLKLERPIDTPHSLVIPAQDAVLKLNAPSHSEAEFEGDALAIWNGGGAVRLLAHDVRRHALLIERCRPGTHLWETTETHQREITVGLLAQLSMRAPTQHRFKLLHSEARDWAAQVNEHVERGGHPFEKRLLDIASDTFETVDAAADWLVNQDVHGGNILSAHREPWLLIDPKPLVGEHEIDTVGILRNAAWREGVAGVRAWLASLQELGLDRDRTKHWGIAHAIAWGWEAGSGWSESAVEAARVISSA